MLRERKQVRPLLPPILTLRTVSPICRLLPLHRKALASNHVSLTPRLTAGYQLLPWLQKQQTLPCTYLSAAKFMTGCWANSVAGRTFLLAHGHLPFPCGPTWRNGHNVSLSFSYEAINITTRTTLALIILNIPSQYTVLLGVRALS